MRGERKGGGERKNTEKGEENGTRNEYGEKDVKEKRKKEKGEQREKCSQ